MSPDVQEKLRSVKQTLRSFMNGPISQSLREKGLGYKVIFGVEWPRLLTIAAQEGKHHDLAQALWKEDIRECRLLAGLIQPIETFYPEIADIWVESMHYPEEAQYTALSLFQHLPYASDKAFQWIASDRPMEQLCGWHTLARLFMRSGPLRQQSEDEFADQAEAAFSSNERTVRQAVRNAVTKYALIGDREALRMRKLLRMMQVEE